MTKPTQLTLDIDLARQERDKGITQSVSHANEVNEGWVDKAYKMLKEWLLPWPKGYRFMMEDFRKIAQIKGLPDPPTARAFGSIAVKARIEGLIKSNGQKPTTGSTGHRCYANEWEKV